MSFPFTASYSRYKFVISGEPRAFTTKMSDSISDEVKVVENGRQIDEGSFYFE
jgi:hypothetical protein